MQNYPGPSWWIYPLSYYPPIPMTYPQTSPQFSMMYLPRGPPDFYQNYCPYSPPFASSMTQQVQVDHSRLFYNFNPQNPSITVEIPLESRPKSSARITEITDETEEKFKDYDQEVEVPMRYKRNKYWGCTRKAKGQRQRRYPKVTLQLPSTITLNINYQHGPLNSISPQGNSDNENKVCIVCAAAPRTGIFVHRGTAHISCCYKCAIHLHRSQHRCPDCNQAIESVLKTFQ